LDSRGQARAQKAQRRLTAAAAAARIIAAPADAINFIYRKNKSHVPG